MGEDDAALVVVVSGEAKVGAEGSCEFGSLSVGGVGVLGEDVTASVGELVAVVIAGTPRIFSANTHPYFLFLCNKSPTMSRRYRTKKQHATPTENAIAPPQNPYNDEPHLAENAPTNIQHNQNSISDRFMGNLLHVLFDRLQYFFPRARNSPLLVEPRKPEALDLF